MKEYAQKKVSTENGEIYDIEQMNWENGALVKVVANGQEVDLNKCKILSPKDFINVDNDIIKEYNEKLKNDVVHFGFFDGMYIQNVILMKEKQAVMLTYDQSEQVLKDFKNAGLECSSVYVNQIKAYYIYIKKDK